MSTEETGMVFMNDDLDDDEASKKLRRQREVDRYKK